MVQIKNVSAPFSTTLWTCPSLAGGKSYKHFIMAALLQT